MHEPLRIGLIGAGQIGTHHLTNYSRIPEVKVVAVTDLFPEKVEAARQSFAIADGYADFQEMLARDDIDAVDVCVHNNKHAPLTIAALKAGKHVYCEKPMAGTYRDAADMLDTAREQGRMLHIQMATLYEAETRAARRLIEDGHLGKIYYARSFGYRRRGRPFVDGYGTANFVNKSISAGGALFDMGIYHIAQILFLMGNPAVKTVTGAAHQELDMYEERRAFSGYSVEELGLGHSASDIRRMYDDNELRCCGLHLTTGALQGDNLARTLDFNRILGNRFLIVAMDQQRMSSRAGIMELAEILNGAAEKLKGAGMFPGYHAHGFDFATVDGEIAWDVLFANTRPEVIMQMDIGNCVSGGGDPIGTLRKFPHRARSVHLKDFGGPSPESVIGEGKADWAEVFRLCETAQNTEWYVVEEGSSDGNGFDIPRRSREALRRMGK